LSINDASWPLNLVETVAATSDRDLGLVVTGDPTPLISLRAREFARGSHTSCGNERCRADGPGLKKLRHERVRGLRQHIRQVHLQRVLVLLEETGRRVADDSRVVVYVELHFRVFALSPGRGSNR
jgi:hypothetical protein